VRSVLRDYLGEEAGWLTREGRKAVGAMCEATGVPVETFCVWWTLTHVPGRMVDNFVKADKTMAAFFGWVDEQRATIGLQVSLEVDSFMAAELANRDNPLRLFHSPVRDVTPLVHYAMGGFFNIPAEVEWQRGRALRQLRERPWYRDGMGDLGKFIPRETEVIDGDN